MSSRIYAEADDSEDAPLECCACDVDPHAINIRPDFLMPWLQPLKRHQHRDERSRSSTCQRPERHVRQLVQREHAGASAEKERAHRGLQVAERHDSEDGHPDRKPRVAIAGANLGKHSP